MYIFLEEYTLYKDFKLKIVRDQALLGVWSFASANLASAGPCHLAFLLINLFMLDTLMSDDQEFKIMLFACHGFLRKLGEADCWVFIVNGYHRVLVFLMLTLAKIKEALHVERLKYYEVSRLQGPRVKPVEITGEERFYMKKMAQKGSSYVPIGRRGVFGGVILNMHMHCTKHETIKVFCKPWKPGQIQEYANELARLSGGIPIQIIGDDTIIFYRGKDRCAARGYESN
ncbi:RNA-binding CRS1 / YhbY (CRM) domain protein [Artemisia annua]|uniref:RNA-binding CRS1 / YhbY (CRM) domain protein n=1 Tax=Artemisia annua TaxID=35608 RepID=A0A2U1PI89_ARTAN|nr:RNA-binding CRS1 / YhbY (CRM) domain protein [Artemisia annua]